MPGAGPRRGGQRWSQRRFLTPLLLMVTATWAGWRWIHAPGLICFPELRNRPCDEVRAGLLARALAFLLREGRGPLARLPWRSAPQACAGGAPGFPLGAALQGSGCTAGALPRLEGGKEWSPAPARCRARDSAWQLGSRGAGRNLPDRSPNGGANFRGREPAAGGSGRGRPPWDRAPARCAVSLERGRRSRTGRRSPLGRLRTPHGLHGDGRGLRAGLLRKHASCGWRARLAVCGGAAAAAPWARRERIAREMFSAPEMGCRGRVSDEHARAAAARPCWTPVGRGRVRVEGAAVHADGAARATGRSSWGARGGILKTWKHAAATSASPGRCSVGTSW